MAEMTRRNKLTPSIISMKLAFHSSQVLSTYMNVTVCVGSHNGRGPSNIFPEAMNPVDTLAKLPPSEQDK